MVEINLSKEFLDEFAKIEKKAEKGNGDAAYIMKIINRGIVKLSADYECGQRIPRDLWPEYYVRKYDVSNLWRLRLDDSWRMIYTMRGDQIRVVAMVLECMDHKDYNKRFGYR